MDLNYVDGGLWFQYTGEEDLHGKPVSLALPCPPVTPSAWETHSANCPVCPGAALILTLPLLPRHIEQMRMLPQAFLRLANGQMEERVGKTADSQS